MFAFSLYHCLGAFQRSSKAHFQLHPMCVWQCVCVCLSVCVCVYTCICTLRGNFICLLPVRILRFCCFLSSLEFALLSPSYSHGLHLSHVSIYTVHFPFLLLSLLPSPSSLHLPPYAFLVFVASCAKFFFFFSFIFLRLHSCESFALPELPGLSGLPWQQPKRGFGFGLQLQLTTFATSVYWAFPADKTQLFPLFPKRRDAFLIDKQLCYKTLTNCSLT